MINFGGHPWKSYQWPQNWIELGQKFVKKNALKCCSHQTDEQNIVLCSTEFDNSAGLVHEYFRCLTSQIGVGSAGIWIFLVFISSKNVNAIFSKVHSSKFALYMLVFQVLSSNVLCILLDHVDMGAPYPILRKIQNSFFRHR